TGRTPTLVRAARRRMTAAAVLDAVGRAMAWAAVAAVVLVTLAKLTPVPFHWAWLAAGPLVLGAVVGTWIGLSRRRSLLGAAGAVDQRLRLKDRLSTATALDASLNGTPDAFVRLAIDDANAA